MAMASPDSRTKNGVAVRNGHGEERTEHKSVKRNDMCGAFYTLQDRRPEMLCISGDPENTVC
jgi:hypothetical protein